MLNTEKKRIKPVPAPDVTAIPVALPAHTAKHMTKDLCRLNRGHTKKDLREEQ